MNFTRVDGLGGLSVNPPAANSTVTSYPTKIDLTEDTGGYAYYRSVALHAASPQSMIDGKSHRTGWTRQILFLRPKIVVVYDTTTVKFADDDRAMFWTFGRDLAQTADPSAGLHRFYSTRNGGTIFKGALTTVLPLSSSVSIEDHGIMSISGSGSNAVAVSGAPMHFLYRVEQRPAAMDHTADTWLNVFDAATSPGAVESVTLLVGANIDAAQLSTSGVVGFASGSAPTLPMMYSFTGTPKHTVAGLTPLTPYHVSMGAGPTVTIAAATGSGDIMASAAGVLTYDSSGAPAPTPPAITTTALEIRPGCHLRRGRRPRSGVRNLLCGRLMHKG